mgnify:CR=1 FL=1
MCTAISTLRTSSVAAKANTSSCNSGGTSNPQPHAASRIVGTSFGTVSYSYDQAGNLISATGGKYRSISYTSFNLPDSNQGAAGPGGSPRYTWQYDESHQRIKETRQTALKQTRLRSLLDGKKRQLMEPLYCKLCTARVLLRLLPDHSFSCFQINCYYQDLAQINMKILNLEEKSSRFRVQLRRCLLPSRADKAE